MPAPSATGLVAQFRDTCPSLASAVDKLSEKWLTPVRDRLAEIDAGHDHTLSAKHLNDPIWRTLELERHEVLLLDSQLLQRLRGVKQLGLAHLVFPGACHDRFEHICGVVEAAERMFAALANNVERRRRAGAPRTNDLPRLDGEDRLLVRLAALMHDVGHGPFSHAIEAVIERRYREELNAFNELVTREFMMDSRVAIAELISVLVVLSPAMARLLQSSIMRPSSVLSIPEIQVRVVTMIMGARRQGQGAYLSAIISGQVDADKLDYMARDAHHSGMPIAFDTERLLRKLEIVRCDASNLPPEQKSNKEFADGCDDGCYFDVAISASGVGALEQMLIGRAFLYDRLYHHHKVRAADAMAQRLLYFAAEERKRDFDLPELYLEVSDDTIIRILGGQVTHPELSATGELSGILADAILKRNLYHRAFAFRANYHSGVEVRTDEKGRAAALAETWSPVSTALSSFSERLEIEERIYELARTVGRSAGDAYLEQLSERLTRAHVVVDLAANRVKPVTINVHYDDGSLEVPNLFFDPARWSKVYDLQKRTGHVFCPREFIPLVALASKVVFFEEWGYSVSDKADRSIKTAGVIKQAWLENLAAKGIIDKFVVSVLTRELTTRTFVWEGDLNLPKEWFNEDADVEREIVDALRTMLPQGMSAEDKLALVKAIDGVASFVFSVHQDARWVTQIISEGDLQVELARHLRAQKLEVTEAAKLGGGEVDLLIEHRVLAENKIAKDVADPFEVKPHAPYQANRYAVAKCSRVFLTVIGYMPKDSATLVEQSKSVRVRPLEYGGRTAIDIAFVVPFGAKRPSDVRRPKV